MFPLLQSVHSV
jgi:hypothetical protein